MAAQCASTQRELAEAFMTVAEKRLDGLLVDADAHYISRPEYVASKHGSSSVGTSRAFPWNYDRSEIIADGVVHAIGVSLGLVGVVALFVSVVQPEGAGQVTPVAVYAAGLLTTLGLSAAYNMWPVSPVKWLLRRFDHSAIYVLIAATYTPFLAQLKTDFAAIGLMAVVWLTAVIGAAVKLFLPGRFDRLAIALYLLLGWSGVIAYRPVVAALPGSTLWLLAVGGVLYSAGVIFHLWNKLRFQNAIWHGFVLVASCCHYTAVLEFVTLSRA
jgi:hemolysin III